MVLWSEYYDFVFSHEECPPWSVIKDDERLDAWVDRVTNKDQPMKNAGDGKKDVFHFNALPPGTKLPKRTGR